MPMTEGSRDGSEEVELLRRCRSNDADACNRILQRYHRKIYNTAYRILGEPASAEDASQEALLNVYRGLARFRGDSQVSTWISRITVNVCLGMMRKGRNQRVVALDDDVARSLPADATPYLDPERYASSGELGERIGRAFARMSPKHRAVVRMHDMEGYTIPEIARRLRCPAGTVKSRLFYGREQFKEIFKSAGREPARKPTVH